MGTPGETLRRDAERAFGTCETFCTACAAQAKDAPNAADGNPRWHALPDGARVQLRAERFRAPEVLFAPSLLGNEDGGVHRVVALAAKKADLCLLYTSPSPRDATLSRMPSSA